MNGIWNNLLYVSVIKSEGFTPNGAERING
jgi:hypothetical protein